MKVAVVGAGAMGSLFGARLAAAGNDVTLIDAWRESVEAVNSHGVRIRNKEGDLEVVPVRAATHAAGVGPVDLVLVFVKCYDTEAAVRSAASLVGEGTSVLTLQNGWGNAERIAEIVGREPLLAGVTYHSATMLGPGEIEHAGHGPTFVGAVGEGAPPGRVAEVADTFNAAGIPTTASPDVMLEIWRKLALNVCTLAAAGLLRFQAGQLIQHDGTLALMRALLREGVAVAHASGIPLDEEERWTVITGILERAAASRPSMLQDVEKAGGQKSTSSTAPSSRPEGASGSPPRTTRRCSGWCARSRRRSRRAAPDSPRRLFPMNRFAQAALAALMTAGLATATHAARRPQAPHAARASAVREKLTTELPRLEALYRELHAAPELSLQEEKTAARMAAEMRGLGFEVTEKVGGHGVVAVLKNGAGPTVLIRTDMDALPVAEQTGLPYASKARARDRAGNDVAVMHACGHDMHMTSWVGTARVLSALKPQWKGTLVFIAQPAEEIGRGAKMMLDDGLFKRFPRPDFCLALHCDSQYATGQVAYTEGPAMANVDSIDITVKGRSGHGAYPHTTVDPIVLAARIIIDLQTLVSRENNPLDPAVVTVGSIHGGTKHNIIPNEVHLQLTVRTTKDSVRKHMLEGIGRIAKAAALGARAPEPEVKISTDEYTPAVVNDPQLTRRTAAVFRQVLGAENVRAKTPVMGGEDFGRYGREGIPSQIFWLGTLPPEQIAEAAREGGKPLPSLHSDQFYPVVGSTIRTGVVAMSTAALDLLGRKE